MFGISPFGGAPLGSTGGGSPPITEGWGYGDWGSGTWGNSGFATYDATVSETASGADDIASVIQFLATAEETSSGADDIAASIKFDSVIAEVSTGSDDVSATA